MAITSSETTMTNNGSVDIVKANHESWTEFYLTSPRLAHPDLNFIHFLHRYVLKNPPMKTALCLGCGDGPEVFPTIKAGLKVTATDISEEAIKRITRFASDDKVSDSLKAKLCEQTDLSKYPDNSFDLVISWSVASYLTVSNAKKSMAEIFRVLREGGSFVGLIESDASTGQNQKGAEHIEGKTFRMPDDSKAVWKGAVITFYNKEEIFDLLSPFSDISMSHLVIDLPPKMEWKVARWMFHCTKKTSKN
jgi:SAM-dependent methyltransferase